MYLLRLDDASEYMNDKNWLRMEELLDKYSIKPIVGVIPNNKDEKLIIFGKADDFWGRVLRWQEKGWTIALHGYNHVYETMDGGLNPVNKRSEFAGLSLDIQKEKIRKGYEILRLHGINPEIFYAPSHTFDLNTMQALREETDIRIISDTVANDVYRENEFYFIPQQSGFARKLPFKLSTFCYHPNKLRNEDFEELEIFLKNNIDDFVWFSQNILKNRRLNILDKTIKRLYFLRRR